MAAPKGKLLNVGCADDPAGLVDRAVPFGLGLDVIQYDYDRWPHQQGVQGDAHYLPFASKSVAGVVIGDVHEHLLNPMLATLEAARVAQWYVILTIFEEWRLPWGHGQNVEGGYEIAQADTRAAGYTDYDTYMAEAFPQVAMRSDLEHSHHFHINAFTDADIQKHVEAVLALGEGWRCVNYLKCPEAIHEDHQWYNWLITFERSGERMAAGP